MGSRIVIRDYVAAFSEDSGLATERLQRFMRFRTSEDLTCGLLSRQEKAEGELGGRVWAGLRAENPYHRSSDETRQTSRRSRADEISTDDSRKRRTDHRVDPLFRS